MAEDQNKQAIKSSILDRDYKKELEIEPKKRFNHVTDRIKEMTMLIEGKNIEPMIDFSNDDNNFELTTKDIRKILPKKYYDFNEIINTIGGKLLYIKSGSTGHTFKGVYTDPEDKRPNYALKVVAYPKKENYGDMYNVERPENAELIMLKVLSQFILSKQTPHIILPICTFNTSIKPFVNLPKNNLVNNKKFDQFVQRFKKNEYYENVSILISEWADSGDLLDYLRKHYQTFKLRQWRVLFFQILSVLAVIHAKYPGFRHNDLKANNLLVQKIDVIKSNNKFRYQINGQTYIVPNIGFLIKLWDFDFACIPGLVDNSKVRAEWTSKINVEPERNQYYDIHYFFNTLIKKGFLPEIMTDPVVPQEVKDFINRVVPDQYKVGTDIAERGRLLKKDEYLTPDMILKKDPMFKVMRQ